MACLNEFDANHLAAETKGEEEEYYVENMATKRKLKNCCKRWSDDKNGREFFVSHKNEIDENSFFKILKKTWNLLFFNEEKKGKLLHGEGDQNMYTLPNFLIIDPLSSGVVSPFESDQVGMSLDEGEDLRPEHVQVDDGEDPAGGCPAVENSADCLAAANRGECLPVENSADCLAAENSADCLPAANRGDTWDDGLEEDEHWAAAALRASPLSEENSPVEDLSPDKESRKKMRTCKKSGINKKYIDIYHKHEDSYSFHDKEIDDFLILSEAAAGVSGAEEGDEQNGGDLPIGLTSEEPSEEARDLPSEEASDLPSEEASDLPSDNRVSGGQGSLIPTTDETPSCPNQDVENPSAASQTEADPPQPGGGNGDT
ncbi:unnamed protein product [Plasmodium vivax]|uniref:(malaria parasite P. vivax) hypothetical protein n=1 Tax=Plasmodium vivax TaxID=5855 RepID=A0A8S4H308_PLAVI|nr:unnamed protein product [Plasmodium vivax]